MRALLIRVRLELSSQDSTIYFVVKRPYDIILTLNKGKVKKKHPSSRQVLSVSPFGHKIIPQWQDTLPRLHHCLNIILFVCQHVSKDQITTFLQEPDLFCPVWGFFILRLIINESHPKILCEITILFYLYYFR